MVDLPRCPRRHLLKLLAALVLISGCARSTPPAEKRSESARATQETSAPIEAFSASRDGQPSRDDAIATRPLARSEVAGDLELQLPASGGDSSALPVVSDETSAEDDEMSALGRAERAQEEGDFEEAARLATGALAAAPDDREIAIAAAAVLVRSQRMDEGIALLEKLLDEDALDPNVTLMLVSANRMLARTTTDRETQLHAMRRAGDLMRQLGRQGILERLGQKGYEHFLEISLQEGGVCAASGLVDQALISLGGVLELGIVNIDAVADHRAWDPIRDAPEFSALVAEHQAVHRRRLQVAVRKMMNEQTSFPFDFRLKDFRGKTVSSSRYDGKILVVDFWGTWCGPCRMLAPHLARLHRTYSDELSVVGIAYEKTARSLWAEAVESYVLQHGVPYDCLLGDEATKEKANIDAFPTLLFVDRSGSVRFVLRGYHDFDLLDAVAALLIDEP